MDKLIPLEIARKFCQMRIEKSYNAIKLFEESETLKNKIPEQTKLYEYWLAAREKINAEIEQIVRKHLQGITEPWNEIPSFVESEKKQGITEPWNEIPSFVESEKN